MASDSPRVRIDQFFASKKKRKTLSPASKSGRLEKEAKTQIDGSPCAKGSLQSYLVTSPRDDSPARSLSSASDHNVAKVTIKRNLNLDAGLSARDTNQNAYLVNQVQSQSPEASPTTERLESALFSNIDNDGTKCTMKDSSESGNVVENPELKEFATGFLSMYCSELACCVSLPLETEIAAKKRHGGSCGIQLEEKSPKRRHHGVDLNQIDIQNGFASTPKAGQSENVESRNIDSKGSKDIMLSDPLAPQASLRKCGNRAAPYTSRCDTPGSFTAKFGIQETPQSRRGSSLFSPGEAFWNEAIQVADGLSDLNDGISSDVADSMKAIKVDSGTPHLNNGKNGQCGNLLDREPYGVIDAVLSAGTVSVAGSMAKNLKNMDKQISPLPVKQLDFCLEGKTLNKEIPADANIAVSTSKNNGFASTNQLSLQNNKFMHSVNKDQENDIFSDAPGKTSNSIAPKANVGLFAQDSHSVMFSTLDKDYSKVAMNHDSKSTSTPASASLEDCLDISNWLPSEICSVYRRKGISKMYPWQIDCLQVDGVLDNRNLVYCASTSAGKSFVAEILMLRRILSTGKIAILVLPYVSICAEKAEHLEVLLEPVDKHVRSYYGNQGGGTLPKDTAVAVCTIEKANSLINRLLEEGRLSELGTIVIDELHMVGDQSRGYLLELMLTKLRYAAGEGNVDSSSRESSGTSSGKSDPARGLQIVGMSATLPNVAAVADWLQAALYETDFRPVPLEQYIKVGNKIYNKDMEIVRTIPKVADLGGKDPDHIVELCNEVVQEGHSVLIFCSSRKGCESTARHIAKYLRKFTVSPRNDQHEPFDVTTAIDSLRRSPAGLDPILEETLHLGVAYHHAGLTVEERETVETCYRKGLVRVLTATSTLAAGVNLPAQRVIFRQPRIGRDFIDGTRYKQMAGRAGRTGIDTKGESVLICRPDEVKRIIALLNDSCPPLYSCLSEDRNGMTHAILEVVAAGIVQTAADIHRYVRCTLLNSTKPFEDVVRSAQDSLRWLCHKKFLEWSEETKLYTSTPLGRASFGSSLCPEESLIVLDDLVRAREGFVLASDLHLVYLVTPINVDVEPDWELYYERFVQLPSLDQSVGNRVGVQEPFLMRMAHGAPLRASNRTRDSSKGFQGKHDYRVGISTGMLSDDQILRVCKRFYVALILSRLVQEVPVAEVCENFKVARGMVQALQENAGRFASMVSVFCERLGWHDLESLLAKFQGRVSFGVRAEIVELTAIPYVKGSRARALYKAGLRTTQSIAEASIPEIAKALFESSSWTTQAQKKLQLGVAKKIKNGARKIVLDKAEEARVAAFSAFKSLGVDITQFSCPPLFNAAVTAPKKESSSSGEESTSSFAAARYPKNISDVPLFQDRGEISEGIPEIKGDKSVGTLAIGYASPVKEKQPCCAHGEILGEKSGLNGKGLDTLDNEVDITPNCIDNTKIAPSLPTIVRNVSNQPNAHFVPCGHQQLERGNVLLGNSENTLVKGPVNAIGVPGGLDSFLDLWDATSEFFFDINFDRKSEFNSITPFELNGMAICWENSPVYYLNIPKDLFRSNSQGRNCNTGANDVLLPNTQLEMAKKRWNKIGIIMERKDVKKFTWNLKIQLQVLKSPAVSVHKLNNLNSGIKSLGLGLINNSYFMFSPLHVRDAIDMSIVAWMLSPDDEKSSHANLEKEVKRRLSSEAAASATRSGRWKDQMRRVAHNGCCRRVAQTRALFSVLWKLLESEDLVDPIMTIEIQLVDVLADMEIWGIGVDMEGCLRARHVLGKRLKFLEREAHKLAGRTFSLSMPADIANILYEHLKLPLPEGYRGKQHPSTDKHCLDMLRNEHPIVPVIKEHRTLSKLLNSTLGSICSRARLSVRTQRYTLHGHWLQTSTATGRLSMEEPNLQCVEHMVEFEVNKDYGETDLSIYKINARDFFTPTQEEWLLLTADYSQIELRLMAHFSQDSALIELLSAPQTDMFTMIAAKWTGKHLSSVSSQERDQTKRLVYGILYGMGPNALAEQLDCSPGEASERIRNFKKSFPGVASWLQEEITSCHKNGYVKTLKGRKRFLSKIKFGNSREKSKAQRQAVNSICQGSAADIIKIAMICIHNAIVENTNTVFPEFMEAGKFQMLRGRCRILLQVHDELVMEADSSVVKEAALLLQTCMETAVSLLVPLPVKLKVGRTWGSLEQFDPNS